MGYLLVQFIRLLPSLLPGLLRSDGTAPRQLRGLLRSPAQEFQDQGGYQIPQGFRLGAGKTNPKYVRSAPLLNFRGGQGLDAYL